MKARIKLADIHALAADYALELHAVGKVEGEYLVLPLVVAQAIKNRHRPQTKKIRGLGDLIHRIALPIAKALKLGCVDPKTNQLKPESPCAKRRALLNKAVPLNSLVLLLLLLWDFSASAKLVTLAWDADPVEIDAYCIYGSPSPDTNFVKLATVAPDVLQFQTNMLPNKYYFYVASSNYWGEVPSPITNTPASPSGPANLRIKAGE